MGKFSKQPEDIPRECWNKYAGKQKQKLTEEQANERAAQQVGRGERTVTAYQCNHCNHWHIGRSPNPDFQNIQSALSIELGDRAMRTLSRENNRSKQWRKRAITKPYKRKVSEYALAKAAKQAQH